MFSRSEVVSWSFGFVVFLVWESVCECVCGALDLEVLICRELGDVLAIGDRCCSCRRSARRRILVWDAMEAPALRFSQIDADQKKFKGFLDVSYGNWSAESTVGDLERMVSAQTGLRVAYIAYRGMRLRKDRQLSTLILDLEEGSCPRFSVHTTTGENVFFVRSLAGNSVMVDIPLDSSTVKDLKAEVHALEKIPTEDQRFLYQGKHFADIEPITKTLRDYGVERDSTVQLLTRLRGGGVDIPSAKIEFSDLQNKSALKVLPWSKKAPVWRIVGKGLNLEGKCTNKACAAGRARSRVVCKKGYTAVNLVTEQAQCPVCKESVQVKTCSFTDCLWMYEGRKVETTKSSHRLSSRVTALLTDCFTGSPKEDDYPAVEKQSSTAVRDIVSPWFRASTKYEYFKQTKNMVQWENLLVVAKKVPTVAKDGPNAAIPLDESCSICFQNFEATKDRAKTHTTSCGHIFHADCVESWLSCSGTACPICRVNLVVEK
ncbi:hypothetical protein KC19_4G187800 [Ceratodon purpureus]|uniref:Uncharacterized protein n=2 Tax=Ceratodon purpureus TaxID=3225 RepID=A0A8T0IAA7_CERPU|nr:hypothetical protein KC19_4G187800 [Ceratodon purpureus]